MPAFEGAVALGYRYVETDVHVTADGVVVAFHDDRLDRVTDRKGRICDLPWSEVALARVDGREPIVRFEELLLAWPDLRINIDPKADQAVEPLARTIADAGAADRVCIGSFSDTRIARCRALLGPTLCTSLGPKAVARLRTASLGVPAGGFDQPCAQVPTTVKGRTLVDEAFVAAAHERGIAVHVWTIDDTDTMHRLLDLGVDGIMTDEPRVLRTVLEARGAWA